MIFEIQTALKTALSSLEETPGDAIFTNVFDYHTLEDDGYPYCTFELSEFDGRTLDVCTNERTFRFNVVVLQAINSDVDREKGLEILYKCLEKIIEKFDGDMDLSESSIIRGDVSKGELGMILEGAGKTLALDIEVSLNITTVGKQ